MTSPILPIVFTDATLNDGDTVYPIKVSIDENLVPVSTATLTTTRDIVYNRKQVFKLYNAHGLAGYYRIQSMDIDYGNDTISYQLENMIAEIGDWCIFAAVSGNKAAATAIRNLWNGSDSTASYRGTSWQLGSMTALSGMTVEMDAKNRDNLLSSILDVLDGCPGVYIKPDFSTYPWTLNFAKLDSGNASDVAYGHLSRNIGSARVNLDFTDLCTRVRYYYESWRSYTADQSYRDAYGLVEGTVSTSSASSLARAQYMAQEYLRKNQEPRISISISGQDLYSITGVSQDKLEVGKLFKLFVPELQNNVFRNITKLSWNDVYGDPLNVSVTLGEEDPTLWAYLKAIKKK